jgi:lysyl endopeptidase
MKNFSLFLAVFVTFLAFSQTTDAGKPIVSKNKIPLTKNTLVLPKINADSIIIATETARINGLDKVFRFGFEHNVSVDFFQQAEKRNLPNGKILNQLVIHCPEALSINLIFSQFKLAKGSLLYISSLDGSDFVGAYTSLNNNDANVLGTELVYSERVVIELIEEKEAEGLSMLEIGRIVHGYLNAEELVEKALGGSGNCNIDVNCPLGQGWENQRNAVACVVAGGGICSGSMVNNTSGTIIPYYLSANHCGTSPGSWVFRFRWERAAQHVICAQTNSTANNGPTNMTVNGGVLRANNSGSDFILVELNSAPNPTWGIYYNGWDRSDALTVTQATGIHHPSGDIKKICRENDPLTQQTTSFNGNPNTKVWRVANWDQGVTEPGSSGSPLFDQNKRTIGVLSGGTAACSGFTDNNGYDIYGRFGAAWADGSTQASRLREWLDPGNTGVTTVDGVDPAGPGTSNDAGLQNLQGVSGTICGSSVTPQITITNAGSAVLTSAVISYGFNGQTNLMYNWSGSLAQYASTVVTLPSATLQSGTNTFNAVVSLPNGMSDEGNANNSVSSTMNIVTDGEIVQMTLNLDYYASETTWELRNQAGDILYAGGGYSDGSTTTVVSETFCLPAGCYTFKLMDEFGDGLTSNNYPSGSYSITNSSGTILASLSTQNANFGFMHESNFCVQTNNINELVEANKMQVYPNPSSDLMTVYSVEGAEIQSISLHDITGKKIFTHNEINSTSVQFSVENFSKGSYILEISSDKGLIRKSVIVK